MSEVRSPASTRDELLRSADRDREQEFRRLTGWTRALPMALWGFLLLIVAVFTTASSVDPTAVGLCALPAMWWTVSQLVTGSPVVRHAVAGVIALVLAVTLAGALGGRSDEVVSRALVATGIVVALFVLWTFLRWWLDTLRIEGMWRHTRSVLREPWARALPADEVPTELAQVHDVRGRPHLYEAVAEGPVPQALRHGYGLRVMVPFVLMVIQGVAGMAALGLGLLDDQSFTLLRVGLGVVLLGPFVAVMARATLVWPQTAFGELQRVCAEANVLLANDARVRGAEPRTISAGGSMRSPLFAVVMVVFVATSVYRSRDASLTSWVFALALVAAGSTLSLLALAGRARTISVYPLLGEGTGLLHEPGRQIDLAREGDTIVLRDARGSAEPVRLPVDQIEIVTDLRPAFLRPKGVGIALSHDVPVILLGGSVRHHPAIAGLPTTHRSDL